MEEIITEYIAAMGYKNLDKNIGTDSEGNHLSADQIFTDGKSIFLIEQKIRDDHDSTKKRGQFENFKKKYTLLRNKYPNYTIYASMWFIDDSLKKNKKYYSSEIENQYLYCLGHKIYLNLFYGKKLFSNLFGNTSVWDEICEYLSYNKQQRSNEILDIPDFDKSIEIKKAVKKLKKEEPGLYKKLISDKPKYVQLRKELFPSGDNIV